MSYGPHTKNPWEHDESPVEDDTRRLCCFCPYALDEDETAVIVSAQSSNVQLAHASCAAECPECHRIVAEKTLVRIHRTRAICGDCARDLVDVATGRELERAADQARGK